MKKICEVLLLCVLVSQGTWGPLSAKIVGLSVSSELKNCSLGEFSVWNDLYIWHLLSYPLYMAGQEIAMVNSQIRNQWNLPRRLLGWELQRWLLQQALAFPRPLRGWWCVFLLSCACRCMEPSNLCSSQFRCVPIKFIKSWEKI